MVSTIHINIAKLPEGLYLATSDDIQGRIAQGRTFTDALEVVKNVWKKLLEAQSDHRAGNYDLVLDWIS